MIFSEGDTKVPENVESRIEPAVDDVSTDDSGGPIGPLIRLLNISGELITETVAETTENELEFTAETRNTLRQKAAEFLGVPWQHVLLFFDSENVTFADALPRALVADDELHAGVDHQKAKWLKALQGLEKYFHSRDSEMKIQLSTFEWEYDGYGGDGLLSPHTYRSRMDIVSRAGAAHRGDHKNTRLFSDNELAFRHFNLPDGSSCRLQVRVCSRFVGLVPREILGDLPIMVAAVRLSPFMALSEAREEIFWSVLESLLWDPEFLMTVQRTSARGKAFEFCAYKLCKRDYRRAFKEHAGNCAFVRAILVGSYYLASRREGPIADFTALILNAFSDGSWPCHSREFLREMVAENGRILECQNGAFPPVILRDDKELVVLAAKTYPGVLATASERLRGDPDVVRAACCHNNGRALLFANPRFRHDKVFVEQLMEISGPALRYCSRELRADRAIVEKAVKQNATVFEILSKALRGDQSLAMLAVSRDPRMLSYVIEPIRAVVLAATGAANGSIAADIFYHETRYGFLREETVALAVLKKNPDLYTLVVDALGFTRPPGLLSSSDEDAIVGFCERAIGAEPRVGERMGETQGGLWSHLYCVAKRRPDAFRQWMHDCPSGPPAVLRQFLLRRDTNANLDGPTVGIAHRETSWLVRHRGSEVCSALREEFLKACIRGGKAAFCMQFLPHEFQDDVEALVAATKEDITGKAYQKFSSSEMRKDVRVVYRLLREGCCLRQDHWSSCHSPENIKEQTFYQIALETRFLKFFTGWNELAAQEAFNLAHMALERGYRIKNLPASVKNLIDFDLQKDPLLKEVDRLYVHHVCGPIMFVSEETTLSDILDRLDPLEHRAGSYEGFLRVLDERGLRAPPIPATEDIRIPGEVWGARQQRL
ncbi:unnamed protein product [Amoebophrya sp. A25]|nr:unnamed protein product [Amoebophrya sp. A25]|eukprot:GSA25T00006817001.1